MYCAFVFLSGMAAGYLAKHGVKRSAKLVYDATDSVYAGIAQVVEDIEDARAEVTAEREGLTQQQPGVDGHANVPQ